MRNYRAEEVITVVGIDLAKQVFHLFGVDKQGKIVLRRQIRRAWRLTLWSYYATPGIVKLRMPPQQSWGISLFV